MRKIIILFLVFFSFSIIGCANETKEEETKEEETKEEETNETKEEETKYKGWINKSINYLITPCKHWAIKTSAPIPTNKICIIANSKTNINHINNWYFVEYSYKPFEYGLYGDGSYYEDEDERFINEYRNYIESTEYKDEDEVYTKINQCNFIFRGTTPPDIIDCVG